MSTVDGFDFCLPYLTFILKQKMSSDVRVLEQADLYGVPGGQIGVTDAERGGAHVHVGLRDQVGDEGETATDAADDDLRRGNDQLPIGYPGGVQQPSPLVDAADVGAEIVKSEVYALSLEAYDQSGTAVRTRHAGGGTEDEAGRLG